MLSNVFLVEELLWYEMLFLEEPHENKPGYKSDDILVIVLTVIIRIFDSVREPDNLDSPCIPVRELLIEFPCKELVAEGIQPLLVDRFERGASGDVQTVEYVDVSGMRLLAVDTVKYGDLSDLFSFISSADVRGSFAGGHRKVFVISDEQDYRLVVESPVKGTGEHRYFRPGHRGPCIN